MADLRVAVSALARRGARTQARAGRPRRIGVAAPRPPHRSRGHGPAGRRPRPCLFRCVQEIVTNAVRHARAENLWIALEHNHGENALDPVLAELVRRLVDAYQTASMHQLLDTLVGEFEKRAGVADAHTEFFGQRPRGVPQERLGLGLNVIGPFTRLLGFSHLRDQLLC